MALTVGSARALSLIQIAQCITRTFERRTRSSLAVHMEPVSLSFVGSLRCLSTSSPEQPLFVGSSPSSPEVPPRRR